MSPSTNLILYVYVYASVSLRELIHNIHFNPVIHGFTNSASEWMFGSLYTFLSDRKSSVCRKEVAGWSGGLDQFKNLHHTIQKDEFDLIHHLILDLQESLWVNQCKYIFH